MNQSLRCTENAGGITTKQNKEKKKKRVGDANLTLPKTVALLKQSLFSSILVYETICGPVESHRGDE